MNSRRRADLHRRLSMGAVPRPPEGLLERIKGDIPSHLHAAPEREQATRSLALSLRVAASIITLILTAVVTRELLEPERKHAFRSQPRAEKVDRAIENLPAVAAPGVPAA